MAGAFNGAVPVRDAVRWTCGNPVNKPPGVRASDDDGDLGHRVGELLALRLGEAIALGSGAIHQCIHSRSADPG
jgi:hypothetical protein